MSFTSGVSRAINDPECLWERNSVQVTLYALARVRVEVRHRTRRYIVGIDHGDSGQLGRSPLLTGIRQTESEEMRLARRQRDNVRRPPFLRHQ